MEQGPDIGLDSYDRLFAQPGHAANRNHHRAEKIGNNIGNILANIDASINNMLVNGPVYALLDRQ